MRTIKFKDTEFDKAIELLKEYQKIMSDWFMSCGEDELKNSFPKWVKNFNKTKKFLSKTTNPC